MANILIIGANSAVAKKLATHYARDGHQLFLVARDENKLSVLVNDLATSVIGSCCLDFNETHLAHSVIQQAKTCLGKIDIAIFAHGYLGGQIKSEVDFEHAFEVIQTNYINVIAFMLPLVRIMKHQGQGKIAVLLSVAGDRGRPRNFTYGSAKGALALYLQGMRSTLYGSGVEIFSFKLGPVDSPMTVDHEKNFSFSSVDKVAGLIIAALNKKRYTRYIPGYWFWVMWIVRWLPEPVFQKLKFLAAR